MTSTHLAPTTGLLPRKVKKSCTALTKSSKGAALPCPQEKQRGSCTALTEKQRVAALRPKNSNGDTSLRVLESYDPKPAPKGKNVRTSARLTRKVASKHRRAAQPHAVQLDESGRKVGKVPCHSELKFDGWMDGSSSIQLKTSRPRFENMAANCAGKLLHESASA